MTLFNKKKLAAAILTGALAFGSMQVEAASNFFADVPSGDWSYSAVNELIATGNVPGYNQQIPSGRIMSRLEMAMIIDEAQKNSSQFSADQRATIERLAKEYFYDIKKVQILNKINMADEKALENLDKPQSSGETLFTTEEADKLKTLANRFSFTGYTRIRHDHLIADTWTPDPGTVAGADGKYHYPGTGEKTRTTDRHHIGVYLQTRYKINDHWTAGANFGWVGNTDEVDDPTYPSGENKTGMSTPDVWVEGDVGKDRAVHVKAGRWNEWTPEGYGYDRDSDIVGLQISFGKPIFRTTFTAAKVDLWDNFMSSSYLQQVRGYETDEWTSFLGVRWDYNPNEKTEVHFGVHGMSAMTSRYQDDKLRKHPIYYYVNAGYKFNDLWRIRGGIINSNAKMIDHPWGDDGPQVNKSPGLWFNVWYRGADPSKPGTYDIYATYRKEPGKSWVTVTDWWPKNAEGFRIGTDITVAKNILFNTMVDRIKEIDTKSKQTRYRFQMMMLFE